MKIIRLGTYKTGFTYYKVKGKGTGKGKCEAKVEITDSREIEKIKELKIPPAYENVTILNNKKIIAYGYDSKNRKQVLYHPSFVATQNIKKYNKISASIKFFSKLKKKVSEDLNGNGNGSNGNQKTMAIAVIISLILSCGFRIGNKKYEKDNNSVGLTTLKYKHLAFKDNKVIIDFIGKKGVRNVAECDNKRIYDYLYHKHATVMSNASDIKDINEAYIFNYDGGEGGERSEGSERNEANKVISSSDVNEYLRVISDPYSIIITTKDLRTWNANMLFLTYYRKLQKLRKRTSKRREATDGKTDTKKDTEVAEAVAVAEAKTAKEVEKDIKKAIEMVAEKLHNSYSICKKSYIDPKIIDELLLKN
jgi:DNA topoisomerase-1